MLKELTPTILSPAPSAKTISVILGAAQTIRRTSASASRWTGVDGSVFWVDSLVQLAMARQNPTAHKPNNLGKRKIRISLSS